MGWYFTSGATRARTIHELLNEKNHRTIAHSLRGNVLWAVKEYERDECTVRYIACFLLRGDQAAYGYKPLCESMGPAEVSCPLYFFDLVPEPDGPYAAEWRSRVRAAHDEQRSRQARKKALAVGDTLQLIPGCRPPYVTIVSTKPLRGEHEGRIYRIAPRHIPSVPDTGGQVPPGPHAADLDSMTLPLPHLPE